MPSANRTTAGNGYHCSYPIIYFFTGKLSGSKVVGPLHGLLIFLKDQLCIKGLETATGHVHQIEKNAMLVDIL